MARTAQGTRVCVAAAALLLILHFSPPHIGFVTAPQRAQTVNAGVIGSLGVVLSPLASFAADAPKAAAAAPAKAGAAAAAAPAAEFFGIKLPEIPDVVGITIKYAPGTIQETLFKDTGALGIDFLSWRTIWVGLCILVPMATLFGVPLFNLVLSPPADASQAKCSRGNNPHEYKDLRTLPGTFAELNAGGTDEGWTSPSTLGERTLSQ